MERRLRQGDVWRGGLQNLSDADAFTLTIRPMPIGALWGTSSLLHGRNADFLARASMP